MSMGCDLLYTPMFCNTVFHIYKPALHGQCKILLAAWDVAGVQFDPRYSCFYVSILLKILPWAALFKQGTPVPAQFPKSALLLHPPLILESCPQCIFSTVIVQSTWFIFNVLNLFYGYQWFILLSSQSTHFHIFLLCFLPLPSHLKLTEHSQK